MIGPRSPAVAETRGRRSQKGVSAVEVMTAVLVLTVGLLSIAGGSGWMIRSGFSAQHRAERMAALQAVVEEVSASPFSKLDSGRTSRGDFDVSWTLKERAPNSVLVEFVAVGPLSRSQGQLGRPGVASLVADTLEFRSTRQ